MGLLALAAVLDPGTPPVGHPAGGHRHHHLARGAAVPRPDRRAPARPRPLARPAPATRARSAPGGDGWERATDPRPPAPASALGRRSFLQRAGVVAALSLAVGLGGQLLGRRRRIVEAARSRLRLPVTRGAVPAGAELGLDGLTPWVSPNADFYRIDTAFAVPAIDVDEWRLRIHGMVESEVDRQLRRPARPRSRPRPG